MRAVLIAAAGAAVLVVTGCSGPAGPAASSGSPTPAALTSSSTPTATSTSFQNLAVGQCTPGLSGTDSVDPHVTTIACSQPHHWEVSAVTALTGTDYPGQDAVTSRAASSCDQALESYVGTTSGYSRYRSSFLAPDAAAWADPAARVLVCLVGHPDLNLTRSAKGDQKLFPDKGECTGTQEADALEAAVLPCSATHSYEVYAERTWTSSTYPTDNEIDKLYSDVCVAGFTGFVGIDVGKSVYEIAYSLAPKNLWSAVKDHRIVCAAGLPTGGITGSLKGVKK